LRHFEDVSKTCGSSHVVAQHFWSTLYILHVTLASITTIMVLSQILLLTYLLT